jgi:hypothetical protein
METWLACWGPLLLRQYASWNGQPVEDFFGSAQAKDDFKAHISFMVNRTNTVNGRKYRWILLEKIGGLSMGRRVPVLGGRECR